MTKITLPNGITLDPDGGFARSAQEYAIHKGLTDVRVFLATKGDEKHYLIVEGQRAVFESKEYEAIGARLDMMAMAREANDG